MAFEIDRFKSATLTEGGADAFVQTTIDTELIPEDGVAWEITQIDFLISPDQLAALAADSYIQLSITRDTKAAVASYNDVDCVMSEALAFSLTTSGVAAMECNRKYIPPAGTIFVEPTIYLQLDSNGTGAAMVVYVRLHYRTVKVTELEILRLLQNA